MSKRLVVAVLLATSVPVLGHAASVLAVPEPQLVAQADTVAVASIIAVRTVVTADGHVLTHADAQVMRAIKGQKALQVFTLQVPGGMLPNGVVADTPGAPKLAVGQVVLGFLEERGGTYRPLGMSFGLLDVKTVGGQERVFRNLENIHLVGPAGSMIKPEMFVINGEPLAVMVKRLESYMTAPVHNGRAPGGVLQ